MNRIDKSLDRLLRAAATAHQVPKEELPPPGWEERILAQWKAFSKEADWTEGLRIFRVGLVMACFIMVSALMLSLVQFSPDAGDEWTYARMSMGLALNP